MPGRTTTQPPFIIDESNLPPLDSEITEPPAKVPATIVSPSLFETIHRHLQTQESDQQLSRRNGHHNSIEAAEQDRAEREALSIMRGNQVQTLTEFTIIYLTILRDGFGIVNGNQDILKEQVSAFYQNQQEWRQGLLTKILLDSMFEPLQCVSIEELEANPSAYTIDDYFPREDPFKFSDPHNRTRAILKAFEKFLVHHEYTNVGKKGRRSIISGSQLVCPERVEELWMSTLTHKERVNIISMVTDLLSSENSGSSGGLAKTLRTADLNFLRFEPVCAQQLQVGLEECHKVQLTAVPDIVIPFVSQQNSGSTPVPIIIDIKTGRQLIESKGDGAMQLVDQLTTLSYYLGIMGHRIVYRNSNGSFSYRALAERRHINQALKDLAKNPWGTMHIYHWDPTTGRVVNRLPLDFLPPHMSMEYLKYGTMRAPTSEEVKFIYDKLVETMRLFVGLSKYAIAHKAEKPRPWESESGNERFILPTLKKPPKEIMCDSNGTEK